MAQRRALKIVPACEKMRSHCVEVAGVDKNTRARRERVGKRRELSFHHCRGHFFDFKERNGVLIESRYSVTSSEERRRRGGGGGGSSISYAVSIATRAAAL